MERSVSERGDYSMGVPTCRDLLRRAGRNYVFMVVRSTMLSLLELGNPVRESGFEFTPDARATCFPTRP